MSGEKCATCGHLRQYHRRLANWEKNEFDGVDGQCYTLTPLAETPRCTCKKYVAPAPPVGADEWCSACDKTVEYGHVHPKPVGRETGARWTLALFKNRHPSTCSQPKPCQHHAKHIEVVDAAALADALREREEALEYFKSEHENHEATALRWKKAYDDSRRENDRCYAKMSDQGFQIADLQRRLDEACVLMDGALEDPVEYVRKVDAFLAANRREKKP